MEKQLLDYLKRYNLQYEEYKHPPIFTVAEGKELKKDIPALCSKNLFLKDNNSNFYLVCMPCEKRLDIKSLQKTFGVKKLKFGTPEELKEHLNITPGSVSLFCMIHSTHVNLIIDKELWEVDFSGYHPNENTSTLVLSKENIKRFCDSLSIKYQIILL